MAEPAYNAADPAQVKKRKRAEKDAQEQRTLDLQGLLKLPEFRRFIWWHMHEDCGLLRSAANPNGSIQSINIGMQDAARILWKNIEQADPKAIPLMMVEYAEREA